MLPQNKSRQQEISVRPFFDSILLIKKLHHQEIELLLDEYTTYFEVDV